VILAKKLDKAFNKVS